MSKTRFLFLIIVLSFFISACMFNQGKNVVNSNESSSSTIIGNESSAPAKKKPSPKDYENSVKEILKPGWKESGNITDLKEELIALTAPVQYLDFHLQLVIALELIEQGKSNSDQVKIDDGLNKISELENQYQWLR